VACKWLQLVHCKKELAVFPSPAGMSLIKLFLGGNNLVFPRPERVWSVTSRLGTGKWLTLFYSVLLIPSTPYSEEGCMVYIPPTLGTIYYNVQMHLPVPFSLPQRGFNSKRGPCKFLHPPVPAAALN